MTSSDDPTGPRRVLGERLLLSEDDARRVVLVRAVEEADLEGVLLTAAERDEATASARRGAEAQPDRALAARAHELASRLRESHPVLAGFARVGLPRMAWILAVAFVLGLLTNVLGAERRIHVLANPLLALVLWNAGVLMLLGLSKLGTRWRKAQTAKAARAGGSGLARLLSALPMKGLRRAIEANEPERSAGPLARAAARYFEDWARVSAPLTSARLRRTLHASAIALTLGALGGMFARGLVFAYRVDWESTFMQASTGQSLLDGVLAPAALISGIDVPELESIEAARAAAAAGDAELEQHTRAVLYLYALSVLLLVVVPRGLLVAVVSKRASQLGRGLALDTGPLYYRRLLFASRGTGLVVDVHPYSFTLSTARADAVSALLHDVFGGNAIVDVHASLAYGAEAEDVSLDEQDHGPRALVLLFNLAQTPELELQGRLLQGLRPRAGAGLVALADCSAWRERVGSGPTFGERLAEHRRTWERLGREVGVPIVHVDLEEAPERELLERIEAALEGRVFEPREESAVS